MIRAARLLQLAFVTAGGVQEPSLVDLRPVGAEVEREVARPAPAASSLPWSRRSGLHVDRQRAVGAEIQRLFFVPSE